MNFQYLTASKYQNHPLVNWVDQFMLKANLYPQSKRAVVGVSGGKDSMLLLFVLYHLYKKGRLKELKVIHIDHQLRVDSIHDGELIKKLCDQLDLGLSIIRLDQLPGSNIEHEARKERYSIFQSHTGFKDQIYTAHHIDDSFEWSLMCQFKTGSIKNTLGIPLAHGKVARPFMCLSRGQIEKFVTHLKIPFREDTTNFNLKFERNFIRKEIMPTLRNRFPSILKHYVYRSNEMAYLLGRSLLKSKTHDQFKVIRDKNSEGVFIVHPRFLNDFSEAESIMLEIICQLSRKERGVVRSQLKKLIDANLNQKKGPLIFSGEVFAYLFYGMIYFTNNEKKSFAFYDKVILNKLKDAHIPRTSFYSFKVNLEHKIIHEKNPIFFAFGRGDQLHHLMEGQKKIDFNFFESLTYCKENQLWFGNPYKLLAKWGDEKNRKRQLEVKIF